MGNKNQPTGINKSGKNPSWAVSIPPEFSRLSTRLRELMIARTGLLNTPFTPDSFVLQSIVRNLSVQDQMAIQGYLSCPINLPNPVVERLLQLDSLLMYDKYTKWVFEEFQKRSDDPTVNGFKTMLAFMIFFLNGPRLSTDGVNGVDSQKRGDMFLTKVEDGTLFSMYNMVNEVGDDFSMGIPMFQRLNVTLMAHAIEALKPEHRYTVKLFVGLPLSTVEKSTPRHIRVEPQSLKHVKEHARFKELTLFPDFGPWDVTSVLAFPGLKLGAPITNEAVQSLFKNLEVLHQSNFDCSGVKRIKQRTILTRFGGIRTLTEYRLGRLQWEFTDPCELQMLHNYLSIHIEDLKFN